jgi:hypothetical protein
MSSTGTVTVISPIGRTVYLNGDYDPDFPKTIPHTFTVEYGCNTFETREDGGRVDYRASVVTDAANQDCSIALGHIPDPEAP